MSLIVKILITYTHSFAKDTFVVKHKSMVRYKPFAMDVKMNANIVTYMEINALNAILVIIYKMANALENVSKDIIRKMENV